MRFGYYCNWEVFYYEGKYYISSLDSSYIDSVLPNCTALFLLCSVRDRKPEDKYVVLDEKVNLIKLPFFNSYLNSFPFFLKIVFGLYSLVKQCDFIYLRTPEPFSWVAALFPTKNKIINYHYASNPIEVILSDTKSYKLTRFLKVFLFVPEFYFIAIAAYFNTATANGPSVLKNVPFFLRKKIKVLYESTISKNTLESKRYRQILNANKIKFLTVSRLQNGKGLHFILDVFHEIKMKHPAKDFLFSVVGDGQLKKSLLDYVEKLDLTDSVNFYGFVSNGSELDSIYSSHDVFLMPSFSETGPRVIVEAMSESNLCISTDVGFVRDLLEGGAGLIVRPKSTADFIKNILWVYDNRIHARSIAKMGFLKSKKYSLESFFDKLLE